MSAEAPYAAAPPLFLELVARAFLEERSVRLTYRSTHGEEREREVTVLGLAFRSGSWLVACHCRLRNALRAFRVERILSARIGGAASEHPKFDMRAFAALPLRDPPDAPALRVAIQLLPPLAALAGVLLPGLAEVMSGGARVVHLRTSRPEAVVALTLSLGDAAELVHPPELARVARRLRSRGPAAPWGHLTP